MRRPLMMASQLLLLAGLVGCAPSSPQAAPSGGPAKLSDIISTVRSDSIPTDGQYYITVASKTNLDAPVPSNSCVDQSFWSFVRKLVGSSTSAAAILTVKVTPSDQSAQAITVPVFSTTATEIDSNGKGSNCQTQFNSQALTFTFKSSLKPTFNVELAFHIANNLSSSAVTNVLADASQLMTLINASARTPAAIASTLASPAIKTLGTRIDTAIAQNWTSVNDLTYATTLDPTSSSGIDQITFKMPPLSAGPGGVMVGNQWSVGGQILLAYSHERFKQGSTWLSRDDVMDSPIVQTAGAGGQSSLGDILLNGTVTGGFKLDGLNSATTLPSLQVACSNLRQFLSKILIEDDALVARFAVLKNNSPYELLPQLRAGSGCFDSNADLETLRGYRADYVFSQQPRTNAEPRPLTDLMDPFIRALITHNAAVITTAVTTPVSNFYVVLGPAAADYQQGSAAVDRLAQAAIQFSCYQARPSNDLTTIAALAKYSGATKGALLSFDANKKLAAISLGAPADVAAASGIDPKVWLTADQTACAATN